MRRFFAKLFACLFVALLGVKVVDVLSFGFNHPQFSGEDILTLMGIFIIFASCVIICYYLIAWEPKARPTVPVTEGPTK